MSDDYGPGGTEHFKIGISSMFAHALGVAPFKDNFWTTSVQPGNPYGLAADCRDYCIRFFSSLVNIHMAGNPASRGTKTKS